MIDDEPEEEIPELPPETTKLVDPQAGRRSRDRIKRERQEREGFWRAVLADRIGRREIWRLLNAELHTFNTQFACGPVGFPDERATWHAVGQQQAGLRLYHDLLAIDHAATRQMHVEHDPRFIVVKPRRVVRD